MWASTPGVRTSWTARTTTAIERLLVLLTAGMLSAGAPALAGVRDHTRMQGAGPAVSDTQASELSLATSEASVRPVQTMVRLRGLRDASGSRLRAMASAEEAALVQTGQRVRVFSMKSRSSMLQARVERITASTGHVEVTVLLAAQPPADAPVSYLVEIVVDRGHYLSVPNDALIDEGTHRVVYVQNGDGEYESRSIEVGIQGELFTAVTSGLKAGEKVVTTGSFFIDADHKMKGGD